MRNMTDFDETQHPRSTDGTFTQKPNTEHWGMLYKNAREIPLDRIASGSTERGIRDRIFRCGTLVFHDAAVQQHQNRSPLTRRPRDGDVGIRFHDIPNYAHVERVVDSARFD